MELKYTFFKADVLVLCSQTWWSKLVNLKMFYVYLFFFQLNKFNRQGDALASGMGKNELDEIHLILILPDFSSRFLFHMSRDARKPVFGVSDKV